MTNQSADNLSRRWRNVGRTGDRRAYTLIELLLIVTLLGIAGALVIPSMSSSSVLRIQATVRTLVSDITFIQSDAMAYQSRRVMVFGQVAQWSDVASAWEIVEGDGYTVYAVPTGVTTLDLNSMWMDDPSDSHSADRGIASVPQCGWPRLPDARADCDPLRRRTDPAGRECP